VASLSLLVIQNCHKRFSMSMVVDMAAFEFSAQHKGKQPDPCYAHCQ